MSVLLGIKDEVITDSEITGWETNKIGGCPDWMTKSCRIPSCSACGRPMLLVLQIYCPLEKSQYHRTMYVFVCVLKQCWNEQQGWRIFRSQFQELKKASDMANPDWSGSCESKNSIDCSDKTQTNKDWCDEADDWGMEDDTDSSCVEVVTENTAISNNKCDTSVEEFQQLNIDDFSDNDCSSPEGSGVTSADDMVLTEKSFDTMRKILNLDVRSDSTTLVDTDKRSGMELVEHSASPNMSSNTFQSFYLSVVDENFYVKGEETHVQSLLKQYEQEHGSEWNDTNRGSSGKSAAEHYEKDQMKHGDKMFHKFMKRITLCPEQLIRYSWNGYPLLMTSLKKVETDQPLSYCPYCKGERVFELQLMPALVSVLKLQNLAGPVVEFGTVVIFTCKNSCWNDEDPYREEAVYIQQDPDQHLFK